MKKIIKEYLPLLAIIILAFGLRLATILKYGNFWDDEMFSFIYSQKAWPQGIIYWLWETNPPLHLFILKMWFFIFPANEFFARLPSLLAGVGAVYCAYLLGKNIFNKNVGILSAFYLAIHPYAIFWSATARTYSFLLLLTTLSTLFLYQQFIAEKKSHTLRLFGPIINLALILSHLSALFILPGQAFALLLLKGKSGLWNWVKSNLIAFTLGFIWIASSFYIKLGNSISQAWFFNMGHTLKSFLTPFLNLFFGQYYFWPGLLLIATFCILIFEIFKKEKSAGLFFLLTIIIVPMALSFGLRVWHIKFFIGVIPLVVIVTSYALIKFFRPIFAYTVILIACSISFFNLWVTLPLTVWDKVANIITTENKNSVFIYNNYILKTQLNRYLPNIINPIPLIIYQDLSWDDMVVKKNYIFTQLSETQKDDWYLNNAIDSYSELYLLQGEYGYMTRLDDLFIKHGWVLKGPPVPASIMGDYEIYRYEKSN